MPRTVVGIVLICAAVVAPHALHGAECAEGDCANGVGRFRFDDGSEYAGSWQGGRFHGEGTMCYADGAEYRGAWRSGKRHGRGTHIAPDGSEYCGTFADDRPAGEGVYLGIDGRRRRVTIRDNKMVPTLRLENEKPEDGCQYGEVDYKGRYHGWYRGRKFDAFKPHGFGAMTWPNGATFTGQWVDGKIHGRGAMVWENGARYSGQWRNGKRDGRGSFT